MKYIIYEFIKPYMFNPSRYIRYEIENDDKLKDFLFKHQDNLKNVEIFNKTNKYDIKIEIIINQKNMNNMPKTIKFIDLLKLMIERRAPKKIKFLGMTMSFVETAEWGDYLEESSNHLMSKCRIIDCLTEKVEIIEEKE